MIRPRFSLRTLCICTVGVAIVFAIPGYLRHRNREVIATASRLSSPSTSDVAFIRTNERIYNWVDSYLLRKELDDITDLIIVDKHLSSEDLGDLGQLPRLRDLELVRVQASAADLVLLAPLQIKNLYVNDCGFADRLLEVLSKNATLERVSLRNIAMTDAGLIAVSQCRSLNDLCVHGKRQPSQFTQKGLQSLRILRELTTLDLNGSLLDASCVEAISQLPSLHRLSLRDCHLSNESLRPLLNLHAPCNFELRGNDVTWDLAMRIEARFGIGKLQYDH